MSCRRRQVCLHLGWLTTWGKSFSRARHQVFTLIEILVALAILVAVLALVLPRIGRLPARLRAERAVSAVQSALSEAALTARARGRPIRLVLTVADGASRFAMRADRADRMTDDILGYFDLPLPDESGEVLTDPSGEDGRGASFAQLEREFDLPEDMVWGDERTGFIETSSDEELAYVFHPGGEAGGPVLPFTVGRRTYTVEVERLTGRPLISERSE